MERLPGWAVCQGIFATFPPPLSSPELGAIVNHDTIRGEKKEVGGRNYSVVNIFISVNNTTVEQ